METISKIFNIISSLGLSFILFFLAVFLFAIVLMIFGLIRNKLHEGTGSALDLANKAQKDHANKWNSDFSVSKEQLELISSKDFFYKGLETQKIKIYNKPSISPENFQIFCNWAKDKKSINKKSHLLDYINETLKLVTPEIPILLDFALRTSGAFFCKGFNAIGFEISIFTLEVDFEFTNEEWVDLLTQPNVFDWEDKYSNEGPYIDLESIYENKRYYLEENFAEFLLDDDSDIMDYWDYDESDYEIDEIKLNSEITFENLVFKVSEEKFTFLSDEREYLIMLLMASNSPDFLNAKNPSTDS